MGSSNGIQLPISLQISNLQDIANQIKQFANKNVLADSFGGKKIDSELGKILSRLEQISAKAKTAFTTQGDFSSIQKEINQVELGLNKVQGTIKNLNFSDLKIPDEFSGQIAALQGRIRELNGSLATFKGTQKEKLISNTDFMADLQAADPKQAAKWLEKGYDELQKAINDGMTRVNTTLSLKAAEYQEKQKVITQNSVGKTATTQLGALTFIQEAFKALPKDDKARNTFQDQMAQFMKATEDEQGKMAFSGFNKGARGLNDFLKYIADSYSFTPEQMSEIRARLKQQVQELSKEGQKITQTDVIKSMGHDEGLAKKILFGDNANDLELAAKKYANDIKDAQKILEEKTALQGRSDAFARVKIAFDAPNKEIKQKTAEIAEALKIPTEALQGFEAQILSAATSSPQIAGLFQKAAGEIATLTNAVEQGKQKLASIDNAINKMQGISNFVNRYVGLYAIVRKVTQAVRNAMANIKDIDKAITSIAVVTNMSQEDLWSKIGEYTAMAQQYGVATKDVYTVSQIFYQQGLQTSQVMQMTTESLKMAKIAGIDYSTAANAMTVAVRAFKLEMSEAQSVTDTYSALAAKFAVSSSEIANAMEKTASSAASVGMSLESTSAFISVMEQTTRESAQNIGSALKSIISRYGEMKASPEKLLNVEGEEVAFNKVDTALASIGISIKDASGQFRDFDDVIMELAAKWDSLDNNTQRYIATIMAGNRQQSRFIALVSNYDELNRAMNVANNSENASIVQVAKTMDSLESKANQLKNAFSQIYLDLHAEEGLKSMYDWLTQILKTVGKLGALKGVLPTLMNVIGVGTGIKKITSIGMQTLQERKQKYQIETDEAKQKIEEVRARASEEIKTQWKLEADLSQLQGLNTAIQAELSTVKTNIGAQMMAANPNLATNGIQTQDILATATRLQQEGKLNTADERAYFMKGYGIDPNSQAGQNIDILLQSFGKLSTQAEQLGGTLDRLTNASDQNAQSKERETIATDQATESKGQEAIASGQVVQSKGQEAIAEQNKTSAAVQAAQEDLNKAVQARETAREDMNKAQMAAEVAQAEADHATKLKLWDAETLQGKAATKTAEAEAAQKAFEKAQADAAGARAALAKAQADEEGAQTERDESNANRESANTERQKNSSGSSLASWGTGNAIKYAGIATGVARLAGTAITAAGAAHQDKSTDTVETSKILTGVGNGLSMAGTGASMGMTLGPWGAVVGAIGGFLIGGLGAIIDGANMTLQERLALEKEEAQKATDESLKQQAKSLDLSGQIDNVKQLQKAMYNSTEDMQAYKDAMNTMASQYPSLISNYDEAGNAIIDLNAAEALLAQTRLQASQAANAAAKAEAKTRKTTISILESAQEQASGIRKTVNSGNNLYNNQALIRLTDDSGIVHDIEVIADSWTQLEAEMASVGQNLTTMSFNEILSFLDNYQGDLETIRQYKNVYFKDAQVDKNGQVTFDEYNYVNNVGDINEQLKASKEALNLNPSNDLPSGAEYVYAFMGWDEKVVLTAEKIKEFEEALIARTDNYKNIVETLDQQLPLMDSQESLDSALLNEEASKSAKISGSKVAAKLIANQLEAAAKSKELTAGEWSRTDNSTLASEYDATKQQATKTVVNWLTGMSEDALDKTLNAFNSMTEYLSIDEVLSQLGYQSQEDFIAQLDLDSDSAQALLNSLQQTFIDANQANKDRILKTIYATGENGYLFSGELNESLTGLNKLNYSVIDKDLDEGTSIEYEGNAALDIAELFESNEIISKYADYFTSSLVNINKLADEGYTALANSQLNILSEFAAQLSSMTQQEQNDIFGILTKIDFSSYSSLTDAQKQIEDYARNNKIDLNQFGPIQAVYDALVQSSEQLIFNVNTLASELTTKIETAAKEIDSIIAGGKSGVDFSKAIESVTEINASSDIQYNFDLLYQYDAVAQKYVYTADGLQIAIQQKEKELSQNFEQLKKATEQQSGLLSTVKSSGIVDSTSFEKSEDLMSEGEKLFSGTDLQMFQMLAKSFMEATEYTDHTWAEFEDYIQKQIEAGGEAAEAAQVLYEEYQANKKNQYYQSIDWSKLALGTDFSGSNKALMQSLAQELGMAKDTGKADENGKAIFEKYIGTWEEVLDEYLNKTYTDDNARKIAKTAINGQIKQQKSQSISTAISEVLQGAGSVISESTAAILEENGKLAELVDDTGLLKSVEDFVHSALELFNTTKNQFTTVSERNKAYLEVIQAGFKKAQGVQTLASSGGSLDISAIGNIFDAFGLNLDDYYNQATNTWNNIVKTYDQNGNVTGAKSTNISKIFKTDMFGNTEILDWDEMMQLVPDEMKTEFAPGNPLYDEWYNAWVQGNLDRQNKDKSLQASAMASYMNAKEGESISIANMPKELKDALGLSGDTLENVSEQLRDNAIMQLDATSEEFNEETQRWIRESQKSIQSKRGTQVSATQGIIKDKVSRNEAEAFSMAFSGTTEHWQDMMESLGFTWNENLQQFIADENITADKIHQMIEANKDNWGIEQYNNALALEKNLRDLEKNKSLNAIRDLLSNYTDVSNEMIATFETQFPEIDVDQFVTEVDGKKQLNVSKLQEALQAFGINITELFTTEMSAIADKYVYNIEQASSLVSSGTTSVADMDTFTKLYSEMFGETSTDALFDYNEVLEAWTLKPEVLQKYVKGQADKLVAEGKLNEQEVNQWVEAQTTKILAKNVNISDFLSAEDKNIGSEAYNQLTEQMREYWRSVGATSQEAASYINNSMYALSQGGSAAIKEVEAWASRQGRTATAEEIESAFNSAINELSDAMDKLSELTVGQITTGKLRQYLEQAGKVDSNGVIISVSDMVDVYRAIYDDMAQTAGKTTASLNQAYAKVLTAGDQQDIDTLEALENASGMTYEALGNILTKYNISLEDFMANSSANGIEKAGFGKIRITDWNTFASAVGLSDIDMETPEYMEAYSSWVDSRTDFENKEKQRVEDAVEELKGLTEAKPGEAINVSHLESVMGDGLATLVSKYGATLNQGMLKLGANTNIAALIQDIADEAAKAGKMIPEQLAELADAVQSMLEEITSLISNGIKGSLNNSDVVKLQNWATQSGLGKLNFQKTADGLKLSEQSAIQLYKKLKEVDGLQAKLVFDDLRESLEATNDNFKDTESLLNHVKKIREGTYKADNTISNARKEQYQAELEIAEEILKVRSTQEDDSYNFMDKKIPAGQNNPLNYMQSWAKAYEAMKATKSGGRGQRGMMAYEDFYNIITEMGRIAELSGQGIKLGKETLNNSQEAADLITRAAAALKVTADGSMKVDLSKVGVDFVTGAGEMNKNVDKGIDAVADSQIKMLDSLIKMLEVIVAMEKLGDVDVDNSGSLELGEIFKVDINGNPIPGIDGLDQYTEKFQEGAEKILKFAEQEGNEELQQALKDIRINGYTLETMFSDAADGVKNLNLSAEAYTAAMSALYQASLSNDYDENNIAETLYKILEESGLTNAEIDVGDLTYYIRPGATATIDFSNKEATEAAANAFKAWADQNSSLFEPGWLSSNPTVKEMISKINEMLSNSDLRVDQTADLEMFLEIASGAIKITDTGKKDANGNNIFEGSYHGETIQGTKEDVEAAIQRAIALENDGFTFKFNDDGSVSGSLNIGKSSINITQDSEGNDVYTAHAANGGSKQFTGPNAKDDALGWLAMQGYGEQGVYTYNGGTYTTFVNAAAGVSYSLSSVTGKYICDGHSFDSWETLQEYLAFKEIGKGGKSTYDRNTNIETIVKGPATITYDHNTDTVTYTWTPPGGSPIEFKSKEAYEAYLAAWDQSGGHLDAQGNPVYNVEGAVVTVNYNPGTGELTYTAHLANGKTVIAHDEDSLMFGIAAETTPTGGEVNSDSKKTYSYVVNAGNVSVAVSVDEQGKVNTTGNGASSLAEQAEKEVKANAEAKLAKDKVALETPVNATASSVKVEMAEGATTTVNLPEKISLPSTIEVTAPGVKVKLADGVTPDVTDIATKIAEAIKSALSTIEINPTITGTPSGGDGNNNGGGGSSIDIPDFSGAVNTLQTIAGILQTIDSGPASTAKKEINGISPTNASLVKTYINTINPNPAQTAKNALNNIKVNINSASKTASLTVKVLAKKADAAGNIGAFAKGNMALAGGTKTLVGELGPELVVSNGRYFVVGQEGAEFVTLQKDAIVFNHQQTERLFAQGGIGSRGIPFTNETNAISYAKGNIEGPAKEKGDFTYSIPSWYWNENYSRTLTYDVATATVSAAKGLSGPAMASASAALAALKQLRAMWQSLKDATAQDLAGLGGSGGGGGGNKNNQAFIKELEKWYNWLQEIATLEKQINFEEAKRKRIQSSFNKDGTEYYKSQKNSLNALADEVKIYRDLKASQEAYFNARLKERNKNSPFSSLYEIDKNGQVKYKEGALEKLSKMSGTDKYGNPNYSAAEQYAQILAMGISDEYLKTDASGNTIDRTQEGWEVQAVQAFWDKMQADQEEFQSLHDSIEEASVKIEELDAQRNEILQEMRDNQLAVEQNVLKAVESQHQREIDNLQDQREALEKSSQAYIQGLTDALNKEQEMYNKNQDAEELNKLKRQLDILKRSGGSGSQIRDLQSQIEARQREEYFAEQQRQIDAIQEASDKELERLDTQIQLQTEILEYQKEMGLLWNEVYAVMSGSAESIVNFITNNDETWWAKSPVQTQKDLEQTFFENTQWEAYRNDLAAIANNTADDKTASALAQGNGTDTESSEDTSNASEAGGPDTSTSGGNTGGNNGQKEYKDKYSVTYTDKNGKKQRVYFDTKEEAQKYAKELNKQGYTYKGKKVKASHATWYVWAKKDGSTAPEAPWGPYTNKQAKSKIKSLKKTKKYTDIIKDNSKKKPEGYATGGYDYETGLAMLHGTQSKPEAVLNATQTQILRDNILSNKPDSLISLLKAYNDSYKDGVSTINNDSGIIIENATVNMNVQQIANDYDAQRAGEQALEKMLAIARKTSAKNSIRR